MHRQVGSDTVGSGTAGDSICVLQTVLVMEDKASPVPRISRPLTETEQFENMLNLGDISEITPEPSEQALQRIRRLELELQQAQRDVEVRDKQIENLRRTQKHLENHQELQRKKINSLEDRLKTQDAELNKLRDARSRIETPDSAAEARVGELDHLNAVLKRENERLKGEASRREDLLVEKERQADRYAADIETLTRRLKDMQAARQASEERERTQAREKSQARKEKTAETVDAALFTQAKLDATMLRRQLAEAEKRSKAMEAELVEGGKARQALKQRVRELEQKARSIDHSKKESEILPQLNADIQDEEQEVEDREGEDEEVGLALSVEQKSVRQSMQQLSKISSLSREGRIRLLNSIIANAENQLDELLALKKK